MLKIVKLGVKSMNHIANIAKPPLPRKTIVKTKNFDKMPKISTFENLTPKSTLSKANKLQNDKFHASVNFNSSKLRLNSTSSSPFV